MEKSDKIAEMYRIFQNTTISEFEEELAQTDSRERKIFCRDMINLKMQFTQEEVIGEILL